MKTVGSMFSGIGGFDLGFERAGFRIAWCIEFDKAAQAVLRKRFPHAKIYGDIREVEALKLERVDVICGGFPCQDLSVAGKRAGLAGSRSGLFHDAIRIVRAIKPAIVVLENVPGLLSSNQGHDFATVIRELGEGWPCEEVAWRVLDSQYFGVAQRRRRVFIVASAAIGHAEQVLALAESVCGNPPTRQPKGQDFAASSQGSVGASFQTAIAESEVSSTICAQFGLSRNNYEECVAATLQTTCNDYSRADGFNMIVGAIDCDIPKQRAQNAAQGHYIAVAQGQAIAHAFYSTGGTHGLETQMVVRRLTPVECERLQGFPDGWTDIGTLEKPTADSHRYKQLGNAVTVNVAQWIAQKIEETI